jgi:hypothetical protein
MALAVTLCRMDYEPFRRFATLSVAAIDGYRTLLSLLKKSYFYINNY